MTCARSEFVYAQYYTSRMIKDVTTDCELLFVYTIFMSLVRYNRIQKKTSQQNGSICGLQMKW